MSVNRGKSFGHITMSTFGQLWWKDATTYCCYRTVVPAMARIFWRLSPARALRKINDGVRVCWLSFYCLTGDNLIVRHSALNNDSSMFGTPEWPREHHQNFENAPADLPCRKNRGVTDDRVLTVIRTVVEKCSNSKGMLLWRLHIRKRKSVVYLYLLSLHMALLITWPKRIARQTINL